MRWITTKTCVWQSFRKTHECFVRKHAFKRERPHRVIHGCGQYEKKFRRAKPFLFLVQKTQAHVLRFYVFRPVCGQKTIACPAEPVGVTNRAAQKKTAIRPSFFQLVEKDPALQRASFSRSVSGIKKASFARFFDTTNSIGSVVPIERLSKTMFSTASKTALWPSFFASKRQRIVLARLHRMHVLP